MGRQALEEEDRLVEMGKRAVGVDLFAEQRDAACATWFAASPQSSESFGVCSAPPTVGVVDASVMLDILAPLKMKSPKHVLSG